ncbi:MAG: hypothetical protein ACXWNC_03640 [Anaerolineales bacterium]
MDTLDDAKALASTCITTEYQEITIDKLQLAIGQEKLRLSSSIEKKGISNSIVLSEEELLDLLIQAIHAEVLPRNFIGKLRDKIEI